MRTMLAGLILMLSLTTALPAEALLLEMTRTYLQGAIGSPVDEFEPVVSIHVDTTPATALVEIGLVIGEHVTVLDGEILFGGPSGSPHLGQMIEVNGSNLVMDDGRITGSVSGTFSEALCFEVLCMEPALVEYYGFPDDVLVMGPGTWAFQSHLGGPTTREIAYGTYRLIEVAQVPEPPTAALVLAGAILGLGILRVATRGALSMRRHQ